eukprot:TRINITY_DN11796_c0_g1_i1.p1 TRINITY_DN11796_c0_g1~~TRINITY_DN11796_c0_g1_i1.p1  ORF type:complete len:245 (+),score=10.26 TRINITY_DN11796_c0_g1_i1:188-922(+)
MASTMGNTVQPQPVNLKDLSHLAGRWVGIYGPHGLEIIEVQFVDGALVGIKVSGDPNVPSGEVTFEVESTGVARGRVAETGFVNPTWLPGRITWSDEELDEFVFTWEGCGSVQFFRVPLNFTLTEDNVRTFLAQNYTRIVYVNGYYFFLNREHKKRGASEDSVKSLPIIAYSAASCPCSRCTVCLNDFEENEEVKQLPCKHYFHTECIEKWLQQRDACPLCNAAVESSSSKSGGTAAAADVAAQ